MTLSEAQWDETDQGKATDSFIQAILALAVMFGSAEIGSRLFLDHLAPFANWAIRMGPLFGVSQTIVDDLKQQQKYLRMLDSELNQSVRSSLLIIGGCSAIEAFIERFVKNRMRDEPSVLDGTTFEANRVADATSLTDPDEIFERQWRKIKGSPGREVPQNERFEGQLEVVNRKGDVPPVIASGVDTAYAIRNVWGHNAGYADAKLLSRAPADWTYRIGDLVKLSQKDGHTYFSVIMTYGLVVANRERACHGLGPVPMNDKPGDSEWGQAYNDLYR